LQAAIATAAIAAILATVRRACRNVHGTYCYPSAWNRAVPDPGVRRRCNAGLGSNRKTNTELFAGATLLADAHGDQDWYVTSWGAPCDQVSFTSSPDNPVTDVSTTWAVELSRL
jgi:hypothetical protein